METLEFRGKPVVDKMKEDILARVKALREKGKEPTFCLVRLGNKENDLSYEKSIIKNCEKLDIKVEVKELSDTISQEELEEKIKSYNEDKSIDGIMIFRPLPEQIDERKIALLLDADKDVDSMNPENLAKLFEGIKDGFVPCTPKAVIEMLDYNNYEFKGANVVVLGRSLVVGKPLAMMFLEKNSTVTICHSKTKDLKEITKKADVVVAALGRAKMLDESYFSENTTVIDVGVNVDENGKLCGDVDFEKVFGKVKALTPVPGGVGGITSMVLMDQIVKAAEKNFLNK